MNAESVDKKDAGKGKSEARKKEPKKEDVKMAEAETKEIVEKEEVIEKYVEARRIIKNRVMASVGLGLVPVPLVDAVGLTAIQLEMLSKLSRLYGISFRKDLGKSIIASLVGSAVPVSATPMVMSLLKAVPVIGQTTAVLTMGALGGATTYAIGKVFVQHFETGGTFLDFDPEAMKGYFAEQFEKGKEVAAEVKK